MRVILIPGLWLDASSWDAVIPALTAAGHAPRPLTLPGTGATGAASRSIGIGDWVAAVVAEIDRGQDPVVLVGHSGGGNVAWGAADARVDAVARVIFVDAFPPAEGSSIAKFPVVDGVVPFPGWDFFEVAETQDIPAAKQAEVASSALSVPSRVPSDPLPLSEDRRHDLPVTVLTGTVPAAQMQEIIAEAPSWAAELAALRDLDIVELHSGHWPQFSQPERLAAALVQAIAR